eukprot:s1971_g17.t1
MKTPIGDWYNQVQDRSENKRNLFVALLDSRSNVFRTFRCLWARELEGMTQHDPRDIEIPKVKVSATFCRLVPTWFPPGLVENMKREDMRRYTQHAEIR